MAAQEILPVGAEVEAQEYLARPGEDGDEGHQGPARTADFQVAEVTPVNLPLFSRQGTQPQEGFSFRPWPVTGNQVPEMIRTSGGAAILDHVVQPGGTQTRKLREGLENERQVGVNR